MNALLSKSLRYIVILLSAVTTHFVCAASYDNETQWLEPQMVSTIIEMKDGEGYFIAAINKKHLSKNPTKRSVIFRNHFRKQADKIAEMSSLMSFEYGKGNYLLKMSVMKDYDVNTMIYSKGPLASSYYAEDLYVVRYDIITR